MRFSRAIAIVVSLLASSPAWAAPVFSNASTTYGDTVDYSAHTHITTATADRLMLICVGHDYSFETEAVTDVLYNSVAATAVVNVITTVGGAGVSRLWLYALIAPASGTHDVEVFFNTPTSSSIGAMVFTGANQTTALGTAATDGTVAVTDHAVVVSSAIDELVADCLFLIDSALTITNGSQTERFLRVFPGVWQLNGTTAPGASPNVTMVRDWGSSFEYATYIGVSIKAAAAAAVARRRSPSFQ